MSAPAIEPPRYRQWLAHVFDHPVEDPAWYWDLDAPDFEASKPGIAALLTHTFLRAGTDLAAYSDAQVAQGLTYALNNACSNLVFALIDDDVPLEARRAGIAALKHVYAGCFETRCAPVLGHIDEPGGNPLNMVCYMLWDASPLDYWEGRTNKELFYETVLDVHRFALGLRNAACIESALHGLGHMRHYWPAAEPTVRDFIAANPGLRPELRSYAQAAARGCVL